MIRRYGEPFVNGQVYQYRPGVYAILPRNKSVLLTHQEEPKPEIQLPGGGIDAGENPVTALHREVFEETGWKIANPRRLGAFRRFTYMEEYDMWAEKICHIYWAMPVRPHGSPREAGHTALWLPPDDAYQALENDGDRDFLLQFFRYSP